MSKTKSQFEVRTPFFRPMWRRVIVAGGTVAWTLCEISHGAVGWAVAFVAIAIYLCWAFFLAWRDPGDPADAAAPQDPPS